MSQGDDGAGAQHPLLTPEALRAIYAQAARERPAECCGIVFGARGQAVADRVHPCQNTQDQKHAEDASGNPRDAHTAYALGTRDLLLLSKSLRGAEPAKIIYHSHVDRPGDGAYFSQMDQSIAQFEGEPCYGGVEYVVVDIKDDGPHGAAQFAWSAEAKRFVEVLRYDVTGAVTRSA